MSKTAKPEKEKELIAENKVNALPSPEQNFNKNHDWQTAPDLIQAIIHLMRVHGITAVWEIGTFQGDTSKAFHEAGFKVITSDIEQHIKDEDKVEGITYILGQSDAICGRIPALTEGEKVAVFIDGDHSYLGCSKDFKACEKVGLAKFVIFHDADNAGCQGVAQFVAEQRRNSYYDILILPTWDGTGIGIARRIKD
jgi:hypothetical protein